MSEGRGAREAISARVLDLSAGTQAELEALGYKTKYTGG